MSPTPVSRRLSRFLSLPALTRDQVRPTRKGARFLPSLHSLLLCALTGLAVPQLSAERVDQGPLHDDSPTLSLNGDWRFRYEAGPLDPSLENFARKDFDDRSWAMLSVPSHWELKGFAEPSYGRVNEGVGYYRRHLKLPSTLVAKDRRVLLRFEGVLYGLSLWVNGHLIGDWASSYNPATFDVTDAIQAGDNSIAVRVLTHPKGWAFDTNDCWGLSGIYREVSLSSVPSTHIGELSLKSPRVSESQATLQVALKLSGPAAGVQAAGRLLDPEGLPVAEFHQDLKAGDNGFELQIAKPHLWSAESPSLYTLELRLLRDGKVLQSTRERTGLRQISVIDGVLHLNGHPIKLRGVDHHDLWPEEGRVANEERLQRDLRLIREANCNFIRTSHYPPHPRLLELCDELGLYVMDEVPFGFGDEHLNDPSYQETLLTRARATVLRDESHPSVIIWSVGNENDNTPLTFATAARVKELDASRPVCFPQIGSYFAKHYGELPAWVDLYSPHYPTLATVRDYAGRLDRPVIFTEYAHSLGLAFDQLQDEWELIQHSPRLAGGAVWMFQDQGILRSLQAPLLEDSRQLAVQPDAAHLYDSYGDQGMDGIVYADRTPQPDYYQVRKVYAPVQVLEHSLALPASGQVLPLHLENRYDFRNLEGYSLDWLLTINGKPSSQGSLSLHAAARATEELGLRLQTPPNLTATDFVELSLSVRDGQGKVFHERGFRLSSVPVTAESQLKALGLPHQSLQVLESEDSFRVSSSQATLVLERATGELRLLSPKGELLAHDFQPHTGRRFTLSEQLRQAKEDTWPALPQLEKGKISSQLKRNEDGSVSFTVHGRYLRPKTKDQILEGDYQVHVATDGSIEFSYSYHFTGAHGLILQAGLSFTAVSRFDQFRWLGAGPFAGYPGKDRLNEYGRHALHRDDLYFQGNRRQVDCAVLSQANGSGLCVLGSSMDLAVEREGGETRLSANALLSGRGTKFVIPDAAVQSDQQTEFQGRFLLLPLDRTWPAALKQWLGGETETVKAFAPFVHSYDQ